MTEKLKTRQDLHSMPQTPQSLIKKVGDQMKALGVDPKLWKQVESSEMRRGGKQMPPQVKLLALNQIVKSDESSFTPHSASGLHFNPAKPLKTNSPKSHHGPRSSESEGCIGGGQLSKTARHDKKGGNVLLAAYGEKQLKTHRPREDSSHIYSDLERAPRDHSAHSGGTRSSGHPPLAKSECSSQRQAATCRAKEAGSFQFKKSAASKSQQKGFSALATKSVLSQQLRRDPQSGGLTGAPPGKLNSSLGAAGEKASHKRGKTALLKDKALAKGVIYELVNNNNGGGGAGSAEPGAGRHPAGNPRCLEQGDRKTLSPDSATTAAKPPLKKRAGHSHTGSAVPKPPGLVLQQPSYY